MMITTIIPVYNLDANRKRNLEFIYERLKEQLPNSKIIISVQSSIYDENKYYEKFDEVVYFKNNFNTFNKSALINYSLNNIKIKSDFVMLLDGDVYFKFKSLEDQIPLLSDEKVIKPFSECVYLTESHTFEFINKRKINLTGGFKKISALGGGAIILKSSLVKDPAVRYDENFSGWGWEDIDFGDSIRSKFSIKTLQQPAIHLYHPVTVESSRNNYVYYNAKSKPKNKIVHTFSHACVDQEHRLHAAQTNALQSFFIAKKNLDVLLLNACSEFCVNNDNIKTIQLNKTAKDIGYNRDLPYLDDVINFAIPYVEDSGWIVYTNSDCIVKDKFYEDILKYNYDYIEFKRQDVDAKGNHIRSISRGVDGFAIRKKILEKTPMPKLIIGAPYWDDVVSKIYSKAADKFMTVNNELIHLDHKATYNLDNLDIAGKFNHSKLVDLLGLEEKKLLTKTKYHSNTMKIYTFYTESHSDLFYNYFLPSVPNDLEVVAKKFPQECAGVFMDSGWMKTMTRKLDYILESIRECWGDVFIHSDCDVQFFGSFLEDILKQLGDKDLAGQMELKQDEICCGFFICRANEKTESLFKAVKSLVNDKKNDQIVLNEIKDKFVDWKTLDGRYFSAIHFLGFAKVWMPSDEVKIERNDILMHHANWTIGVENKKKLMEAVKEKIQ